jgi:adhesin transport system outer membrane protein
MLAASLPTRSEPYAQPSVLANLDAADGRSFEDEPIELSVPGLHEGAGQSIDTIAIARAADREAPNNRDVPENRVHLALLGDIVDDNGLVDIGGKISDSMVASADPSDGDGAYRGDIVILPAAESLLGKDLDGNGILGAATVPGDVRSLRGAVTLALETNPEIGQASANRQAIEAELAQGRGNYLPRLDLEARAGVQVTDNPTTRRNGDDDRAFAPVEGRLTVTQLLFDGFATDAEVERQASRVDGASYRVWERSEFIALNVIRAHQDIHRLGQILGLAQENLSFHRRVLDDISKGTRAGAISVADRQQAEERIISAQAFMTDTREELEAARITFNRLVGQFPAKTEFAPPIASQLPPSLDHAIGTARANSPIVKIVDAAISQAYAEYRGAESGYLPTLNLELTGRAGEDLDGVRGRDAELRAMLVLKWNLYAGGVKPAGVQERIRRIDEARMNLHVARRDAEETMRISWDRWVKQRERLAQLQQQLEQSTRLLGSYQEQYGIGRRSLLDVLDTQNTRFGTQVAVVTSQHAVRFAEYRILAAGGELLKTLGLEPPATAEAYARADAGVPTVPEPEAFSRSVPSRP